MGRRAADLWRPVAANSGSDPARESARVPSMRASFNRVIAGNAGILVPKSRRIDPPPARNTSRRSERPGTLPEPLGTPLDAWRHGSESSLRTDRYSPRRFAAPLNMSLCDAGSQLDAPPGMPAQQRVARSRPPQPETGEHLGLRKMAYEIKRRTEADTWYRFERRPYPLTRSTQLKIADGVLRFGSSKSSRHAEASCRRPSPPRAARAHRRPVSWRRGPVSPVRTVSPLPPSPLRPEPAGE